MHKSLHKQEELTQAEKSKHSTSETSCEILRRAENGVV